MSLRILELHGFATIQGAPRFGLQRFGVPSGGAFDLESLRMANRICGNDALAPAMELALARAVFQADKDVLVAVAGAWGHMLHDATPVRYGTPIWMQPGQRLTVEVPSQGVLSYLAVRGGLSEPLNASRLQSGDVLDLHGGTASEPTVASRPPDQSTVKIPIELGPQSAMFQLTSLFGQRYEVTRAINRQGIRLHGFALTGGKEIESEPCCPGAVQVTGNGQLIIVGPDGPTIGGYPKIAVVTRHGLNMAAQRRPGQKLQFEMAR